MANVDLASLTQRLDRLEHALARFSVLDDLVNSVDPPPSDLGRLRPDLLQLRLIDILRQLIPKGDPPPNDLVRARLGELVQRNPGWFADPPPEDFLNVRVLDLIRRWRGGFTDPAPADLANVRLHNLLERIPGGGITDPGPDDLARLTKPELEAQLHKINTEMVRLKSLERLLNERLSTRKD